MGVEIAALLGLLGLASAFALVGLVLAGWMAWRIVEKAGLPGWAGLGAILLTLTGIGSIVPLILLWVFAFMRWPRDGAPAVVGFAPAPGRRSARASPAARAAAAAEALADRRGWKLAGGGVALAFDDAQAAYVLTGAGSRAGRRTSVADPSVGRRMPAC